MNSRTLSPEQRLAFSAARLRACQRMPYLSAALFALQPVLAEGLGTFAVDAGWRLYLDPERLVDWELEAMAGVLLHECLHLVRDHAGRRERLSLQGAALARLFNIAGDLAINDDLVREGVPLPDGVITPSTFGLDVGDSEEAYFGALLEQVNEHDSSSHDVECGSGAHGEHRDWEVDDTVVPPLPPAAAERVRAEVAQAVRRVGNAPAGLQRWAAECTTPPRIDWRKELWAFVHKSASGQSHSIPSYHRPRRRPGVDARVILPTVRKYSLNVVCVIDTSGSVSEEELGQFLAEIARYQQTYGQANLVVLVADAGEPTLQKVHRVKDLQLVGGGGTDLRPALEYVSTIRPVPDACVVFTDGWTPWPKEPQRVQTIVVTTDRTDAPAWMHGIKMESVAPAR